MRLRRYGHHIIRYFNVLNLKINSVITVITHKTCIGTVARPRFWLEANKSTHRSLLAREVFLTLNCDFLDSFSMTIPQPCCILHYATPVFSMYTCRKESVTFRL